MNDYSECEGLSDDVDSDTETYLYAKLHYEWEMTEMEPMEHGLELRNEIATTVPIVTPMVTPNRNHENRIIDKNPAKRKKIDDIRPKSDKIPAKIEKVDVDSDNDDKFSKYNQTFKTASTEIKQKQDCIQIVDLSSDSDSDCIVLNDHNSILLADGNVLTTLESTLGVAEEVDDNVKSLKRKRKRSKKKNKAEKKAKDINLKVQESCSKSIPHEENLESMMTIEPKEILDPFPNKFGNTMSFVDKMQRFYDSDCSLMDDCELERLMKGTNKIKKMIPRKNVGLNGRYFGSVNGVRCDNCRQWDHIFEDCPEPFKKLTCYLCGEIGHYAAGCPKLSCGICFQKGHGSWKCHNALTRYKLICTLCECVGHISEECPDLWRRYYLTTKPGPLVKGDPRELRKSSEMYCCNCGRKGHYVFDCTRYKMKPAYHPIWPFVIEYKDPNRHVSNNSRENSSHRSKHRDNREQGHSDRSGELIKEAQFLRKGKKSSHRSFKSKKSKKKYMYKNVKYNMQMRR